LEGGAGGGVDGGFCYGRMAGGGGGGVEGGAGGGEECVEVLDYAVVDGAAGEAEEVCVGEGALERGRGGEGRGGEGRGGRSTAESALVEAELGSQGRVCGWFGHGSRVGGGGGVRCFGGCPEEARHFEIRCR
jgi:hypothetical protein